MICSYGSGGNKIRQSNFWIGTGCNDLCSGLAIKAVRDPVAVLLSYITNGSI